MNSLSQQIENTNAELIRRWTLPHPNFSSGQDPRSSEQSLLELFYGGIENAARYQWQNAGRTLIDKTYLSILWTALELDKPTIGFENLAANLDSFIRRELTERWSEFDELDHEAHHQLAVTLVTDASQQLFGSQSNEGHASNILFFLCPQLPIFPYSEQHRSAVQTLLAESAIDISIDGYSDYHQACRQLLARTLPFLCSAAAPRSATADINAVLRQTDWWQRHLLGQQIVR
ncbi:MAG: hypothetical protein V7707_18670 [Motiliproteus sp.]